MTNDNSILSALKLKNPLTKTKKKRKAESFSVSNYHKPGSPTNSHSNNNNKQRSWTTSGKPQYETLGIFQDIPEPFPAAAQHNLDFNDVNSTKDNNSFKNSGFEVSSKGIMNMGVEVIHPPNKEDYNNNHYNNNNSIKSSNSDTHLGVPADRNSLIRHRSLSAPVLDDEQRIIEDRKSFEDVLDTKYSHKYDSKKLMSEFDSFMKAKRLSNDEVSKDTEPPQETSKPPTPLPAIGPTTPSKRLSKTAYVEELEEPTPTRESVEPVPFPKIENNDDKNDDAHHHNITTTNTNTTNTNNTNTNNTNNNNSNNKNDDVNSELLPASSSSLSVKQKQERVSFSFGDEHAKPRSHSKSILGRRSFSPSQTIGKIIPIPSQHASSIRSRFDSNSFKLLPFSNRLSTETRTSTDSQRKVVLSGITYASDRKNNEFHKLFKNSIGTDEKLIQDYSCALSKDILVQGKIYISNESIHFYSNILGYITTATISFNEIVQLEKKTTVGIFPNAISIDTMQGKFMFVSLANREAMYDIIMDIWNQYTIGNRMKANSSDEDSDISDDEEEGSMMSSSASTGGSPDTSTGNVSKKGDSKELEEHAPTTVDYTPQDGERKIGENIIQAPMSKVFNIVFGDDVEPLTEILKKQKNYDISPIPKLTPTKKRNYTYTKPLTGSIGPSKTRCIIEETLDQYDLNTFIRVTQLTKNPDVPSGDIFQVKTTYLLSWDANNSTKILTYVAINWTGKSWIKGAIEKGTFDGVTETTKSLLEEVNKLVLKKPSSASSKKSHKKKSTSESISTLPKIGPVTHAPTKAQISTAKDSTLIVQDSNIPTPLGTTYLLLFGDDTSYLKTILEKQNNFNISPLSKFTKKSREYNYIKRLNNSMGPKQTKCFITEKIEHYDLESYIQVKQISKTPDVPSGNSFTVNSDIFLSWGEKNTTNVSVFTNIVWSGRSFLKGPIEKGSIDGQKGSTKVLIEELKKIISSATTVKGKRRSKTETKRESPQPEAVSEIAPAESGNQGMVGQILDIVKPLIDGIDITSIKTLGSIVVFITFFVFLIGRFRSSSTSSQNISIIRPGKLMIDGDEFNYVPSFKTMYDTYEQNMWGKQKNMKKAYSSNLVTETETTLWDWINDRGDANIHTIDEFLHPDANTTQKAVSKSEKGNKTPYDDYNMQKLLETIRIANVELAQMQKRLQEVQGQNKT